MFYLSFVNKTYECHTNPRNVHVFDIDTTFTSYGEKVDKFDNSCVDLPT